MKNTTSNNCDNCANMTLSIGRDHLMHRHCNNLNRVIPDHDHYAVCGYHRPVTVKGGAR